MYSTFILNISIKLLFQGEGWDLWILAPPTVCYDVVDHI